MKKTRNYSLDFVKGICVIVMVIYHTIDYYFPQSFFLHYLLFVSGAFVFITGFIITHIYPNRFEQTVEIGKYPTGYFCVE